MKFFGNFKKKDTPVKDEKSYQSFTNNDDSSVSSDGKSYQSSTNNNDSCVPLDGTSFGIMPVDDVFALSANGCVVIGKISNGYFSVGDSVEIIHKDGSITSSSVGGIEIFMKKYDWVQAGDNADIMLRDVNKSNVRPGDVIRNIGRPEEEEEEEE